MKKFSKKNEKELRKNINATFRGKDFEYNEVIVKIKKYSKDFMKILICLCIVIIFIFGIFLIRRTDYYKQLKSTTWYEETAYLESNHAYTESNTELDGTNTEITKYKRFYGYTGKDNVKYWHSQTGYDKMGEVGEELKIYVDEKDNSKSMEIKMYNEENFALIIFTCIVLGPVSIIYFIIILRLRFKKIRLDIKQRKEK